LLILRSALYSNGYEANFRVWEHWLVSSVEVKNEWNCSSDPPFSFTLFSGKNVPLPHLPNPHLLLLVLFCYIYYVSCINFDAMCRAIFRSINLEIPAKRCALLFDLHQQFLYLLTL